MGFTSQFLRSECVAIWANVWDDALFGHRHATHVQIKL
jgi:hypothetical protein